MELFCVLEDLAEVTGQVSEVESYIKGNTDEAGPHPLKDSFLRISSHLCLDLPSRLFTSGFYSKYFVISLYHVHYMPPPSPPQYSLGFYRPNNIGELICHWRFI